MQRRLAGERWIRSFVCFLSVIIFSHPWFGLGFKTLGFELKGLRSYQEMVSGFLRLHFTFVEGIWRRASGDTMVMIGVWIGLDGVLTEV